MEQPKLLVVSFGRGLPIADAVIGHLRSVARPVSWTPTSIAGGGAGILDLLQELSDCDYGVFVLAPNDVLESDGDLPVTGSHFEDVRLALHVGLGALGHERCFVVAPRGAEIRASMPSALVAQYAPGTVERHPTSSDQNSQAVREACNSIAVAITKARTTRTSIVIPGYGDYRFGPDVWQGKPGRVYHNVDLLQYCHYARAAASTAKQLVTVLFLEPRELINDIVGAKQAIARKDRSQFLELAERQNTHYKTFRMHSSACRLVVRGDDKWINRNRTALVPLKWLNGDMQCYVVSRNHLVESNTNILLNEHTAFDDHVCRYDRESRTLTVTRIESLMTDPSHGYQRLWDRAKLDRGFVTLNDFLGDHGIDPEGGFREV